MTESFQLIEINCLKEAKFNEFMVTTKSLKCVTGLEVLTPIKNEHTVT